MSRKMEYNTIFLQQKADELEKGRAISRTCRELGISRQHFYGIIKGESASFPMLMRVGEYLGLTRDQLLLPEPKKRQKKLSALPENA